MARGKADRSEGRVELILLVLLCLAVLAGQRNAAQERRSTPLLASDIQAPVARWVGTPFRVVEASLANAEDRYRALEENKVLRAELSALRRESARTRAMRARLKRLETVLALRVNGDIPETVITARAVADPASPFVRSLLLGAGRHDGVKDGYAVMSDVGMVGHVVSAGQRSARVLKLDDLNSRIAVMSERSGARAILAGANDGAPTLRFVADPQGWQMDDKVVTSGDDGRLPQGLPVGKLADGNRVTLAFMEAPVDWVMIVPHDALADERDVETPGDEFQAPVPDAG